MEPRLQELIKGDQRVQTLIGHALRLEGLCAMLPPTRRA